ncbi:MAG: PAS domain S-box protein [Methylibium sp.]|uniref:PAS domain S-box protein n=1 Tax=Methylibium sp. TaxID=2067992 RepID=UPI0017F8AE6D|nr:PAS domain S-box protein [Methylibium sp.]MBA3597023.1 PAS domain S-box protein [Methylibium sp.]
MMKSDSPAGSGQPPKCPHEQAARKLSDVVQALRDSEERHIALVDVALDAIISIDCDDRILEFNPAAEKMFGYPRAEVLGREMAEMLIPPRLRKGHRDGMARHSATGETSVLGRRAEFEALRRDGSEFPVELTVTRLGRVSPPRFTAFIRDITSRRAFETAQRGRVDRFVRQRDALLALMMGPRTNADDAPGAFRRITEVAARTLDVARVSVWRYTPDRAAIHCMDLYDRLTDVHSAGMELTAAAHPAYFAALSRTEVIAADDAHTDPSTAEFSADYLRPLGIGSMLDAPIHLRGQADGVLCHEHVGPPRHWEEDEKTFVLALANLVSLALEGSDRATAEAALRDREQQYRSLAENLPTAVARFDRQLRHLYVNRVIEQLTGQPAAELIGCTHAECGLPPALVNVWESGLRRVFETGQVETIAFEIELHGRKLHIESHLVPETAPSGEVVTALALSHDVSAVKRALLESQTRARLHASLTRLTQEALAGVPLARLRASAVAASAQALEVELALLLEWLPEPGAWRLVAGSGLKSSTVGDLVFDLDERALARRSLASTEPLAVRDRRCDGRIADCRVLAEHGAIGGLSLAIPGELEPWGVLCAWANRERDFSVDEVNFLQGVAKLLADAAWRARADEALRRSEGLLRIASRAAQLGGWRLELADGRLTRSDELCRVIDVPVGSVVMFEHVIGLYAAPWREAVAEAFRRCASDGSPFDVEGEFVTAAGRRLWVREIGHAERDEAGNIVRLHGALQDITDRKNAEAERARLATQRGQSQKMESLGTLAGGIAHDFNNILGAILGNLVLARAELGDTHAAHGSLLQIERAGWRARDLVRQILSFSRQQPQVLVSQPLRPLIEEVLALLRTTLPAGVVLDASLAGAPLFVRADATQIQQVVINLCTNAWHALGKSGGCIDVSLDAVTLDELAARGLSGLPAGHYARLSVSDTGQGMDEATRTRAFEPFFTTKPAGEGTGLGLSVVHGIVTSCAGAINFDSTPGRGTCFRIFLPVQPEGPGVPCVPTPRVEHADAGGRHVLYLDDDEVMLLTVERLLQRAGYRVTVCPDATAALAAVRKAPSSFDAVVTDFNMPGLSGLDVVGELLRLRADLPVVITSGYISDALRAEAARLGVRQVIGKERLHEALITVLHEVLQVAPARAALPLPIALS